MLLNYLHVCNLSRISILNSLLKFCHMYRSIFNWLYHYYTLLSFIKRNKILKCRYEFYTHRNKRRKLLCYAKYHHYINPKHKARGPLYFKSWILKSVFIRQSYSIKQDQCSASETFLQLQVILRKAPFWFQGTENREQRTSLWSMRWVRHNTRSTYTPPPPWQQTSVTTRNTSLTSKGMREHLFLD